MSDFGAVLEYAMQLEAAVPEAAMAKFEEMRPAAMGPTKKEREELAKKAAQPAATPAPAPAHAAVDDRRK